MKSKIFLKRSLILILFAGISFLNITCKRDTNSTQQLPNTPYLHPTGLVEDTYLQLQSIPLADTIDTTLIPNIRHPVHIPTTVVLNVPLPGDQGSYNSCVGWAVGYGLHSYHYRVLEGHNDYSGDDKKFSPNYIWNQLNGGYNIGIRIYDGLSLVKDQGCCKLTDMPINVPLDELPSTTARANAGNYKLTDFYRVSKNIDQIKFWISRGFPIICGMNVDNAFQQDGATQFEKQSDGRLVWKKYTDNARGGHVMLICGYDNAINAFKVLNSWGSKWGDSGYIWIDYEFFKIAVYSVLTIPSIYLGVIKRPFLTTSNINSITQNSAQGGGIITSDWGNAVTARGVCWSTSPYPRTSDAHTTDGSGIGSFTSNIAGLTANTPYYVCAYATNSEGISYGNQLSFTTPEGGTVPTVSTNSITNITQTTATGGGNVTSQGSSLVTARGVCWSTSSNPTISDSHTTDGSGTGSFTSNIAGLIANTPYYVRAYATSSAGTAYGSQVSFTTIGTGTVPTVSTNSITNITETTATGGGNVTAQGSSSVTARGVCWSASSNPTTSDSHTTDGSGTGSFTSNITGLTANTPYYVRAYATNSAGTSYGSQVSFTTTGGSAGEPCPGIPTVTYGGQTYNTVQIGTQCWFKENINIGTRINGTQPQTNNSTIEKYCYNDLESNCDIYGGLYQWAEMVQYLNGTTNTTSWNPVPTGNVIGICPSGWHIPSNAEWTTLTTFLGGVSIAGGEMRETGYAHWAPPNTGATNSSGFTALPGGMNGSGTGGGFQYLTIDNDLGSSTEYDAISRWIIGLNNTQTYVYLSHNTLPWENKLWGQSVRCIKD